MIRYALRRLGELIAVLAVAVVLSFFAVQFVPGDPVTAMLSDQAGDPVLEAQLRAQYGLDQPLWIQFYEYVGNIFNGTFGLSYRFPGVSVLEVIAPGLAVTPLLAALAMLISVPLGVVVGCFVAIRHNTWTDTVIIVVLVTGISVPNFALATFLVALLAVGLGWLPVGGWGDWQHLVMPVLVLAIPASAYIARLTRTYMLEVLQQDFVRTARAKGLPERLVVYRHALRNVWVPLLTTIGVIFGTLLSGTFVVETVFNIPGLGRMAIDGIFARDYPVAMSVVLLFTFFYSFTNLIIDLAYGFIDPRIRVEEGTR